MGVEGSLNIQLLLNRKETNKVAIQSTRPVYASRVFHGKSVSESLAMLPLLFTICGVAQSCAGVRACEQALAVQVPATIEHLRKTLVYMETLREHLWRLFLDWPLFTETVPDKSAMAEVVSIQRDYQQALCPEKNVFVLGGSAEHPDQPALNSVVKRFADLLRQRVFSIPVSEWLALSSHQELVTWAASQQTSAAKLINQILEVDWNDSGSCQSVPLPELDAAQLFVSMQDANFVKLPQWSGQCCETSSLTRVASPLLEELQQEYGNGLLVRLIARLTEIAQLSTQLLPMERMAEVKHKESVAQLHNPGIGQVAAARGQLVHRVEINNGLIDNYKILAPTEWNFHPGGVVAQALASLDGDREQVEKKARLLINSIDPCVGYKLHISVE